MFGLVAFVVSLALSAICYLLMPQTVKRPQSATPGTISDSDVPTCTEGNQIPVVFGERWIDPNVVWYGDFSTSIVWKWSSGGGK